MYIPNHTLETDRNKILDFIKRFNFGTIVTAKDNFPSASHLPFLIEERGEKIFLISHFAKANKQWQDIAENVLVIFSEPHAYITPKFYEKLQNVPTWNYISVHCYGKGKILHNFDDALNVLEKSIDFFDASYKNQWESLDKKYRDGLIGGITAFEIEVSEIQSKKKLSQNKTENERNNIINAFEKSEDMNEKLIAEYMKKEREGNE
ncbi:MAG: FMN-binding negative transcriptional regulator [Ignavibacteria bacterium]|nr:FMN-binding negative transcriptional regulator [Ignavibacteria bacterium]